MDALTHVLKTVFADQLPILILLSLSWFFIYVGARAIDFVLRKSLLRFPFYLRLQVRRFFHGIPKLRALAFQGKLPEEVVIRQTSLVGQWLNQMDKELSNLMRGKQVLANLLFGYEGLLEEIKSINLKQVALLEADQAFIQAGSRNPTLVNRGLSHIVENPEVSDDEASRLLFHMLNTDKTDVRRTVVYILRVHIRDYDELNKFEKIVSPWSLPLREEAFQAVREIRGRLQLPPAKVQNIALLGEPPEPQK